MGTKKYIEAKPCDDPALESADPIYVEENGGAAEVRIFRQSFLDSSDAIMITDLQGIIVEVNPAFETIYGFSRDEAIGRTPRILRHDSSGPELYLQMWNDILDPAKGHWKGEITNQRKDGTQVPVMLSITPIRDAEGSTTHYMGLAMDISEKRKLEAKVQQLRREYGAFLRHEMRNRLAAVTGYLELAMNHAEPVPERLGKYLKSTQEALFSTVKIIDALRELEHYELGQIELEKQPVSLRALIERACADLRPISDQGGVSIEIQEDADLSPVQVDPPKMESVFFNLLKNAVEHVSGIPGEVVSVRLYKERNRAAVAMNNRGASVPRDRLATFFERFNTTKKDKGGTGLGTTYAALITRAHGGDIRVASNARDGTTVTVLLPQNDAK